MIHLAKEAIPAITGAEMLPTFLIRIACGADSTLLKARAVTKMVSSWESPIPEIETTIVPAIKIHRPEKPFVKTEGFLVSPQVFGKKLNELRRDSENVPSSLSSSGGRLDFRYEKEFRSE